MDGLEQNRIPMAIMLMGGIERGENKMCSINKVMDVWNNGINLGGGGWLHYTVY